jgi:hypothetical protein
MWLGWLTPIRWVTVFGSTVLSALAAATILSNPGSRYVFWAGLCALGAAILNGLHDHFHCDAYQASCRRLIGIFAGLEAGFQRVHLLKLSPGDPSEQELEKRFEEAVADDTVGLSECFRKRARNETRAS